jgi:chemotaxis signal transduction protein
LNRSETVEPLRLVQCRIGNESYFLDMGCIHSIQRYERMERNPAPEGPLGWLNRPGSRLPVFTMPDRLGQRSEERSVPKGAIVVLNGEQEPWGLAVDRVSRPLEVGPDRVMAVPGLAQSDAFEGVVLTPEGPVLRLLPDRLHLAANAWEFGPVHEERPKEPLANAAAPRAGVGRVLLFSAPGNALVFGLSFSQVLEVCAGLPQIVVPGAPNHVLGMVQWRERPVAVIDIAGLTGLAPFSLERQVRVLIVRPGAGAEIIGIPVETEIRWRTLPLPHQPYGRELPVNPRYVRGVFDIGDEVLLIPDLNAIVEMVGSQRSVRSDA